MTAKREQWVCNLIRQQVIYALKCALEGDESIMKEAWEQLEDSEEFAIADKELAAIIHILEK